MRLRLPCFRRTCVRRRGQAPRANVIALLAAGRTFASIDDDSDSTFFAPVARGSPKHVADPAPTDVLALDEVARVAADPWSPHAKVLATALRELPGAERAPERMRVAASFLGAVGDLGVGAAGQWSFLGGETQARLANGLLDHVFAGGGAARIARAVQPSVVPFGMMGAFGADAKRLLPPLLPCGRGQDALFVTMLRLVDDDAVFVHLPLAVAHRIDEPRTARLADIPSFGKQPRLCDLVRMVLARAAPCEGDRRTRLATMARVLDEQLPSLSRLGAMWNELRRSWADALERNLRTCPAGAFRDASSALAHALASPVDLAAHAEGVSTETALRSFGRLLHVWPALWDRAVQRGSAVT